MLTVTKEVLADIPCLVLRDDRLSHTPLLLHYHGWTGDKGRELRATHLLLWQAIELLKADGYEWFDLGGVSAEAPGVERFKLGLGGAETWLVGGYV